MHHPTDRIAHTTAFVTPVVDHWLEREIAQWVHPMTNWLWNTETCSEINFQMLRKTAKQNGHNCFIGGGWGGGGNEKGKRTF